MLSLHVTFLGSSLPENGPTLWISCPIIVCIMLIMIIKMLGLL